MWTETLAKIGVTVETVDADRVRVLSGAGSKVLALRRIDHRISPSQVPEPPSGPALLSVLTASHGTADRAVQLGWNLVTDDGMVRLRLGRRQLSRDRDEEPSAPRPARPGPIPWATFTVVRRLLAGMPASQVELANWSGVSQSKVSRVLRNLTAKHLAKRGSKGWEPTNFDALLDWWIMNYPGPGGVTSYWYSLDDPLTQARAALRVLGEQAVVSGDVAADALAPWRRPSVCMVYVRTGAPMTQFGFVPVASQLEATLILCAPRDPGVWLPHRWTAADLPLADPLQVVRDVLVGAGTDRDEAAAHLRDALGAGLMPSWQVAVAGTRS